MPNKLRQAHSHTRMQTHQPLHICSSSHIHAHKLTQHPSMSPEYVNIYTKNTLLWRHAMHSRQIKVAPLYFINKWPSFYCVWCIIAGYSEDKCFYNLSLKCKSFHRLWNYFFADATRAAWAGRNNIISSNIIALPFESCPTLFLDKYYNTQASNYGNSSGCCCIKKMIITKG